MHLYRSRSTIIAWRQGGETFVPAMVKPARRYRVEPSKLVRVSGVLPGSGGTSGEGFITPIPGVSTVGFTGTYSVKGTLASIAGVSSTGFTGALSTAGSITAAVGSSTVSFQGGGGFGIVTPAAGSSTVSFQGKLIAAGSLIPAAGSSISSFAGPLAEIVQGPTGIYRNLHASLMRFCQEFSQLFTPGVTPTFTNFDAAWDESELPRSDLIGYFALTYEINDQIVEGSFQVGYSTLDDRNLFRLVNAIDKLAEQLKPSSKIVVYDAETGIARGHMICKNGTRVMPVAGSKNRPVQFVGVNFTTTLTYQITGDVWQG